MHPLLFEISLGSLGILQVPAFGALVALAFGVGLALTSRAADRAGLARDPVLGVCLVALFAGLLGARLGFVLLHANEVGSFGAAFSLRNGGLSGSLGLVAGAGALAFAARHRSLPWRRTFDLAAPAFAAGVVLMRLGCWLEGCDFGRRLSPTAPDWLARLGAFPAGSPAFVDQAFSRELALNAARALPVHPSELYESAAGLVLLGLALALRRRELASGFTALAVFVSYFALRVAIDFTRVASADVWCARAVFALALGLTAAFAPSKRERAPRP
jgi:phosphatidylglycerol:prolipoprotein diacylglycerol transferase